MLKGLWQRIAGGGSGAAETPASEPVEYKGFRIRAMPFQEGGQFQTAGSIEAEIGGEVKTHKFIRAEKHASREEAEAFSLTKAKQIIDQQGERIFTEGR